MAMLLPPACKTTHPSKEAKEQPQEKVCECPDEATKAQTESFEFLKDALFPREWSDTERSEAMKSVRNYHQGFFAGPGGSWGSCQFQVGDELLARILADKEARAKKKEFAFRADTPPQQFRNWFDSQAMGLFANKKGKYETCQVNWWTAGKHPGEYFRSWEQTMQPPRWSVVVKVCPNEKGMRWVFFRCTAE